jgi:hypothetical protein
MKYELKKRPRDLVARRKDILAEYRFYQMDPMRIGGEVISIELAVMLGMIVDTTHPAQEAAAE